MVGIIEKFKKNDDSEKQSFFDTYIFKSCSEYYKVLTFEMIAILSIFLFVQIGLMRSCLFLSSLFFIAHCLLFCFTCEESHRELGWKTIKISLSLYVTILLNSLGVKFFHGMINSIPTVFLFMSVIVSTSVLVGFLVVFSNKSVKESLESIQSKVIMDFIFRNRNGKKKGDIQLGLDAETGEPIIIPFKDRFVHTLILGPTGSGKTSQTIIPMINQDINEHRDSGVIVIEPKGDLAEKVWAMGVHYGRDVLYFNPTLPDCPYFNPMFGDESDVIENIVTTFRMLNPDSPTFFLDQSENLLRKAVALLKRLKSDDATLIDLNNLVWNTNQVGERMVRDFLRESSTKVKSLALMQENEEIAAWFLSDYFTGSTGERTATKTYEHCSGVRTQISKLVSNKYLRKVLNPPAGIGSQIDFDEALADGLVIAVSTAQGKLGALGGYLGYFVILQLESSVFRRKGKEKTRRPCYLYIDEFQEYANPGFAKMLTQGRSYRVASHLATQNRVLIGMGRGQEGKDFLELVSTNARNVIIYPGGNKDDAKYYSEQFGEVIQKEEQVGVTRQKFNPIYGLDIKAPSEQRRVTEKLVPRFTPSNIIYRPFGEIICATMKDNSIQTPRVCKIQFIDNELNDKLDNMVDEFNDLQEEKTNAQNKVLDPIKRDESTNDVIFEDVLMQTQNNNSSFSSGKTPKEEIIVDTPIVNEDVLNPFGVSDMAGIQITNVNPSLVIPEETVEEDYSDMFDVIEEDHF